MPLRREERERIRETNKMHEKHGETPEKHNHNARGW